MQHVISKRFSLSTSTLIAWPSLEFLKFAQFYVLISSLPTAIRKDYISYL